MRKADELLSRLIDAVGQPEAAQYVGLFGSWHSIVGERVADHTQPVDVKGTSLVIEADHPGWVQLVMMRRGRIVREVSRRFPELRINGIMVRVASRQGDRHVVEPANPTGSYEAQRQIAPSETDEQALAGIEDEQMRETLRRLRGELRD